jgi:Major tropism determinant N-terminal domain
MTLRLRRGTDLQRQGLVLAEGELVYVTDTKEIYAGDGSTLGGIKVTGDVLGSPPRLTQNLDLDGYNIAGIGTISATAFIGDGSQLTGIASSGGGVIEGQEYQIDIVGDVKASNSTVLVDSSTSSFFGNFVGDGSLLSNLELNQNTDVNILLPTDGDILQYTGGIWVNTPLTINIVEGTDYRFNIIGDDSTKIVDTATGNVTGNFIGDGSLITNLELNQNTDVNILLPAEGEILKYIGGSWSNAPDTEGIIEGGNYKINIVGLDSTTIVDVANNEISTDTINTTNTLSISNNLDATQTVVKINTDNEQSILSLNRQSTTNDLSIDGTLYGSMWFGRNDNNGYVVSSVILGGSDILALFVDDGTNTFPESNTAVLKKSGNFGLGTFNPTTKLEIKDGSLRFDESRDLIDISNPATYELTVNIGTNKLAFYDGVDWRELITSNLADSITDFPGAIVFSGLTQIEIDNFGQDSTEVSGGMVYNTTADRLEFFQAGSWIPLANQELEETSNVRFATVTAESFISTGGGAPTLESETVIDLQAGERVRVTTSPFRLAQLTTTERNAISPVAGDLIYNTTDNRFQGYQNGGWINLDDGTSA